MARGGYREKAGRKSTWASGCSIEETKLIRVPAKIADEVLKAAHSIDAGYTLEKVNLINKEDEQIQKAKKILSEVRKQDKAVVRRSLAKLLEVDIELLK